MVVVVVVVLLLRVPPLLLPQFVFEQQGAVLTLTFPFPPSPPSLYQDSNPGGDYAPLEGQWKDGLCDFPNQWSPSCLFSCFISCLALAMLSKRTGMLPSW